MKNLRIISLILALVLTLSSIPFVVFAEDATATQTDAPTEPVEKSATISFADTTCRTEYSSTAQVWKNEGVVFTNNKGSSSTSVGDYANPVRIYANSEIVINVEGGKTITKVVFTINGETKYVTAIQNAVAGTTEGKVHTVEVNSDTLSFKLSAQTRLNSVTVYYLEGATVEPEETTTPETEAPTESETEAPVEPETPSTGNSYNKITSLDQLTTGKYVIIVNNGYALATHDSSSKWVLSGQPTVSDGSITEGNASGYVWTVTVDGTSVILTDANGESIAPKGGNDNGIASGEYSWAVSCSDGEFQFKGTGSDTVTLAANTGSSSKFRAYKNTTVSGNPTSYPSFFTLYKFEEAIVEPEETTDTEAPTETETETETEAPVAPDPLYHSFEEGKGKEEIPYGDKSTDGTWYGYTNFKMMDEAQAKYAKVPDGYLGWVLAIDPNSGNTSIGLDLTQYRTALIEKITFRLWCPTGTKQDSVDGGIRLSGAATNSWAWKASPSAIGEWIEVTLEKDDYSFLDFDNDGFCNAVNLCLRGATATAYIDSITVELKPNDGVAPQITYNGETTINTSAGKPFVIDVSAYDEQEDRDITPEITWSEIGRAHV